MVLFDNKYLKKKRLNGFTLIEILVVISIIGILVSLSLFGIQNSRKSARDAKRKSDIESIRSALEMYKADNGVYPDGLSYLGSGYIPSIPLDPLSPDREYSYSCSPLGNCVAYSLCASLEISPSPPFDTSGCSSCTASCNYKTTNP